eukprot:TRINITY_DN31954_c0_g3_i1.p1 TRINITY_DN31954_c0_g3~~TRINITY_DN31954_c0_g3_i1.p1  ORF type:complete len:527 (-),score=120.00 TRINITY_DN31954_c0_g3_i1:6-1586(-)
MWIDNNWFNAVRNPGKLFLHELKEKSIEYPFQLEFHKSVEACKETLKEQGIVLREGYEEYSVWIYEEEHLTEQLALLKNASTMTWRFNILRYNWSSENMITDFFSSARDCGKTDLSRNDGSTKGRNHFECLLYAADWDGVINMVENDRVFEEDLTMEFDLKNCYSGMMVILCCCPSIPTIRKCWSLMSAENRSYTDMFGRNILHLALRHEVPIEVVRLILESNPELLSKTDAFMMTPLMVACSKECYVQESAAITISTLLEYSLDNQFLRKMRNSIGKTALMMAVKRNPSLEVVKVLLKDMSKLYRKMRCYKQRTALIHACASKASPEVISALIEGMPKAYRQMLDREKNTALIHAAMYPDQIETIGLLLKGMKKSYRMIYNRQELTAFGIAAREHCNPEVMNALARNLQGPLKIFRVDNKPWHFYSGYLKENASKYGIVFSEKNKMHPTSDPAKCFAIIDSPKDNYLNIEHKVKSMRKDISVRIANGTVAFGFWLLYHSTDCVITDEDVLDASIWGVCNIGIHAW